MNEDLLYSNAYLSELKAIIAKNTIFSSETVKLHKQLYFIQQSRKDSRNCRFDYFIRFNPQHYLFRSNVQQNPLILPSTFIEIAKELLQKQLKQEFDLKLISNMKTFCTLNPLVQEEVYCAFKKISKKEDAENQVYEVKIHDGLKDFMCMNIKI